MIFRSVCSAMARLAIHIDGGYMANVAKSAGVWVDFELLSAKVAATIRETTEEPLDLIRTYYYDCLPYQSASPTLDEEGRRRRKSRFFNGLRELPNYAIREGRLTLQGVNQQGQPIFQQKRVDLMMGLDIARLAAKGQVTHTALLSGDSDLIPAVEAAQQEAVIVWLVHDAQGAAKELRLLADNRILLDDEFLKAVERTQG